MTDDIWTYRFLGLAKEAATWSRDPSTKVGCVIANDENNVVSIGCNGFPRKIVDSAERFNNRELKNKIVQHAECNAISNCARTGNSSNNCTMFVTHFPCVSCAGKIIQSGIKELVYDSSTMSDDFISRWFDQIELSTIILTEANVKISDVNNKL